MAFSYYSTIHVGQCLSFLYLEQSIVNKIAASKGYKSNVVDNIIKKKLHYGYEKIFKEFNMVLLCIHNNEI